MAEDRRSGARIRRPGGQTKGKFIPGRPGVDPGIRYRGTGETDEERETRIVQIHHIRSMSQRYKDLMDGTLDVEDLEDEEVVRGQLRAADGSFKGRPPAAVPRELYLKMQSEAARRWENKLKGMVDLSIEALGIIVKSGRSEMVRYNAAVYLIERTMGKIPDKVQVSAEIKRWENVASDILIDIGETKELTSGEEAEDDTETGLVNDL